MRKGEFRFYLDRPGDGKYIFKVPTEADREEWIRMLQRVINVSFHGVWVDGSGVTLASLCLILMVGIEKPS